MSAIAEVTKLAASIVANLPIIKGIQSAEEHEQALALMDLLLEVRISVNPISDSGVIRSPANRSFS